MRTCSNCGSTVREGARFCTACGTRLNDTGNSAQINSWALNDSDATTVAPAVTEADPVEPNNGRDAAEGTGTAESTGFSWSWGSTPETQPAVEDDDGSLVATVSEESEPSNTDDPVDATEIDILADDPSESDEPDAVAIPDDAETLPDESTAEAQDSSDEGDDDTLAAWAGEWSSDEDAVDGGSGSVAVASGDRLRSTVGASRDTDTDEDDDEDPAERAERLLAELQKVLPRLGRRKAPVPVTAGSNFPTDLFDDVDDDNADSFDDVRQTIESVRNNPRDIDTMLKLAGNSERLKALLDDRDRLANRFETLRSRLRDQMRSEAVEGEDHGDKL